VARPGESISKPGGRKFSGVPAGSFGVLRTFPNLGPGYQNRDSAAIHLVVFTVIADQVALFASSRFKWAEGWDTIFRVTHLIQRHDRRLPAPSLEKLFQLGKPVEHQHELSRHHSALRSLAHQEPTPVRRQIEAECTFIAGLEGTLEEKMLLTDLEPGADRDLDREELPSVLALEEQLGPVE
jgi:hypothetical protein